jgi:hypothetical protein
MLSMDLVLALARRTGARLGEVGFLLILIAGVWLVFAETANPQRWRTIRTTVAGVLLAAAGLLLVIATHWGEFG